MAIDLSALSTREALTAIYIGYYDRAADPEGIDFWEGVVNMTSLDLVAITSDFASQTETQSVHPFFADPATNSPATFITTLYQNLFNRDPDAAGLTFWSNALDAAVAGEDGAITVGEIITAIIEGAEDTPADPAVEGSVATLDQTTILNKIEVGLDWTDSAVIADIDFATNTAAQTSARSIIDPVDATSETVTAAKAEIDNFFAGDVDGGDTIIDGDTILLTSSTDVLDGTADNDLFNGYIAQNPFAGGISNTLSSADRLDGGAGDDRLYAEITNEFVGVDGTGEIDIQPRLTGIEEIDLEARDSNLGNVTTTVDAKNIVDHEEIGSYYSDGDLRLENITTLTSAGTARNTSEITITMDHTDNFNSDGDASDVIALFDNDYLLSGREAEGQIFYFLLDEDAELEGLDDRLDEIDVDGIRFNITIDGVVTPVTLNATEANTAGTHEGFVEALQDPLQALIDDGTLPAGTTLTLDPTITDTTFIDDGSESDPIPAIVLTSGDGSVVEATGFSRIADLIGEFDVFGRFESINEVEDQPISVGIELEKAGRGGEGGDLIVGGKDTETGEGIAAGIEVFNISVLGTGIDDPTGLNRPSDVGTITSTGSALTTVNIVTDAAFASGTTYAALTVRNGFDEFTTADAESGDLQLVNADGFLGNLTLGDPGSTFGGRITNLDTLTAQGGGDVTFNGLLDGTETDQAYTYTTAGGDDTINLDMNGDALDYANSSVNIVTGGGDDTVDIDTIDTLDPTDADNNQLNQAILDNVRVSTGSGDDVLDVDDTLNSNLLAGSGDDIVYTDGDGVLAAWAFNVDPIRAAVLGLGANPVEDLPGIQTSLAYLGGASITVTLSGAGVGGAAAAGGGVMSVGADGAIPLDDGYESTVTIETLINGNEHYGDQRDINDAVIRAIESDPVLDALLSVTIGANNTLVISSKTSGAFDASDLRIDVAQNDTAAIFSSVETEAQSLFSDSTITVGSVADANTAAGNDLETTLGADGYYDGLSASGDVDNGTDTGLNNLHTAGTASTTEVDGTINGGSDDDIIVLSTDAVAGALPAVQNSSNNDLINGASNETVIMTGDNFGDDTIMNFTDGFAVPAAPGDGIDFLDFTDYLTSQESASDSTASAVDIAVTLDTNVAGVTANEVAVIDFDNTPTTDTFAGLGATQIAAMFNGGTLYGSLTAGTVQASAASTAVVGGDAAAILMVQNVDNEGLYKVFELEWDASLALADITVAVTDLGSLDFGDELTALDEANLIGSAAQAAIDFSA